MDNFLSKLKTPLNELWQNNKLFVIFFGLLILAIKYQDVIFNYLVKRSKDMVEDSEKKDTQLRQQENDANNKANDLVNQANQLNNDKPPVDADWYKKK